MMTMGHFEEEKARLMALYGATARDASGKRAQAFAILYARSGWKTEALAETEKITTRSILRLCVYGRFLLGPNGSERSHIPERRFRDAWQRTDQSASEETRFAAVHAILADAHQEYAHLVGNPVKQAAEQVGEAIRVALGG